MAKFSVVYTRGHRHISTLVYLMAFPRTFVAFVAWFVFVPAAFATQPNLFSQKALVVDAKTNEVLVSRNANAVTPIASITKLMTALVIIDARQPMDELIEVGMDDFDTLKGSRSRLRMGVSLMRKEMLAIALMSSENRAASALCRAYPGGNGACIAAMNDKARALGMNATSFADSTGLSPNNLSTAEDLVKLMKAVEGYPLVRDWSVQTQQDVFAQPMAVPITFGNSNGLVRNPQWNVFLQKTGYIAEAGNCVVMGLTLAGRRVWLVLLDAAGRYSRFGDAHRIRTWMETGEVLALPKPQAARKAVAKKKKKVRRT
jgi:serine-type D-Ala-D-Ala endopeptidase (penicillin-binding protein 7)